jgi:hypothetical protein
MADVAFNTFIVTMENIYRRKFVLSLMEMIKLKGSGLPYAMQKINYIIENSITNNNLALPYIISLHNQQTYVIKSKNVERGSTACFLMCWNSITSFSRSLSSITDTCNGLGSLARKLP